MRIAILLLLLLTGIASAETVPAKLHRYYGTRAGYSKVTADVMDWHKTRQNGCVAFASTALRHIGVEIPLHEKKDGLGVSRITGAFARYLMDDLGWKKIEDPEQLVIGDIVFTTDHPCCAGYPAHVMMFDGWAAKDHSAGYFVDNQGFHVRRALKQKPGSDVDGFQYALRP